MQVSLIIPIRDEAKSLRVLIESIKEQTRTPDEIILVDGGSTDQTVELARQLILDDSRFRIIEAGDATPGRGRNVGFEAASYDWIALTDAGIKLETVWLERLIAVVEHDATVDVVYGNYEPVVDSLFKRCAALAYVAPKEIHSEGLLRGPSIASMLLRRSVWQAVDGIPDQRSSEDLIFFDRIEQRGFKLGWAPSATVWWELRPTLKTTFQKFVSYSKHTVYAGWQKSWHYGLAKQYLIALPFFLLAIVHSPWWLIVPLLGFIFRVAKNLWKRREEQFLCQLFNPLQFLYVGFMILIIDLATFIGWAQAVLRPQKR